MKHRTVKPPALGVVAESPSPVPPPRSRARASNSKDKSTAMKGADGDDAASRALLLSPDEARAVLAEGVFGVVVLLASEWVEVGSGLAEISMRADTWGNHLLNMVLQVWREEGRMAGEFCGGGKEQASGPFRFVTLAG